MDREEFRQLCLLLRPELRDADIPHRTTMHNRIVETCDEALDDLSQRILVRPSYYILWLKLKANFCPEEQYGKGVFHHGRVD